MSIRHKIRSVLLNETNLSLNQRSYDTSPEQKQINVFDDTVGVMSFKYDPNFVDIQEALDRLKPYFDDINVKYVNLNTEFNMVSMNVEHQYKELLEELMHLMGFKFDSETFGTEQRSAKYPHHGGYGNNSLRYGAGIHGGFSLPVLIGEV